MYLTHHRIQKQIDRADKLQRILWRLYSPYRTHRKAIVKASALAVELVEILEELQKQILDEENKEKVNPLPTDSIPPGGYNNE